MTILFGKLTYQIFNSGNYYVYHLRVYGGEHISAVYIGINAPRARKTVSLKLTGHFETNKKYGKQFVVSKWEREDKNNGKKIYNDPITKDQKEADILILEKYIKRCR